MALIGNGSVLHKSPGRFLNGYGTTGGGIASMRRGLNKHGMQRNAYQSFYAKSATPDGHLSPSAWVLPKTAGGMSSRNVTALSLAPTASIVGGVTTTGETALTFTVADAQIFPLDDSSPMRTASATIAFSTSGTGGLIATATGVASLTFAAADALLLASLGGQGSAAMAFTTNAPLLGAIADGSGAAVFAITPAAAQAYPLNDAPPLCTGVASFAITGALTPYAVGRMSGSTVDTSVLTSTAIAAAVWDSVAAQFADSSTFGGKLNTASSGGVDLVALAQAVRAELATELARLDVRVGTRASQADVFAA